MENDFQSYSLSVWQHNLKDCSLSFATCNVLLPTSEKPVGRVLHFVKQGFISSDRYAFLFFLLCFQSQSPVYFVKIFVVNSEPDVVGLSNLLYMKYLDLNWLSLGLFLTLIKDPVIPGSLWSMISLNTDMFISVYSLINWPCCTLLQLL
jgi:hypothetical protein